MEKLEWLGYQTAKKFWRYVYSFWQNSRTWQMDTACRHRPHLHSIAWQKLETLAYRAATSRYPVFRKVASRFTILITITNIFPRVIPTTETWCCSSVYGTVCHRSCDRTSIRDNLADYWRVTVVDHCTLWLVAYLCLRNTFVCLLSTYLLWTTLQEGRPHPTPPPAWSLAWRGSVLWARPITRIGQTKLAAVCMINAMVFVFFRREEFTVWLMHTSF